MPWPTRSDWTSWVEQMADTPQAAAPLRAKWFNGRSSRAREVLIVLEPGPKGPALTLHVLDLAHAGSRRFEHAEVEWPPQWSAGRAPERVTVALQDHGSVEIDQPLAWQQALDKAGARPGLAQRMQTRWPVLLGVLAVAVIGLVAFYRYGTPWAAAQLSRHVPLEWELGLSQQALDQIDKVMLKPSQLPPERQEELRTQFTALLAQLDPALKRYPSYAPRYALHFRRGLGPNAFALPGGTLVMTDELVESAAKQGLGDDALLGVLAHEIGHVEHRHGTRLIVEQGVLNIGLGLALGDVSSMVALASTTMTSLAYRRQHETESDCFALALMARAQRPTAPMADLLLGMSQSREPRSGPPAAQQERSSMADWLSTHPATPDRALQLKAGALCR
jgi:Zn-dependent protease with chaperone function